MSLISSVLPDGSGRQDTSSDPSGNVGCATPDPDNANKTIYAWLSAGSYHIYRGSTFSPASSTQLATTAFESVSALLPTSNGDVVVVGSVGGDSKAYLLSGGTATLIDFADSATVTLDGTKVAYTKLANGVETLNVWTRAGSTKHALITDTDVLFPCFSKDGAWIVYSASTGTSDTPWDVFQIPTAGGTVEQITNTPGVSEFGACYNEARTMVSYVGLDSAGNTGVYVTSNNGTLQVASDTDINLATYWTTALGRSRGVRGTRYQSIKLPKRLRRH